MLASSKICVERIDEDEKDSNFMVQDFKKHEQSSFSEN